MNTPHDLDDQSAAVALLAIAETLEAQHSPNSARACRYAAARLLEIPELAFRVAHPSVTSPGDALNRVVEFITNQQRGIE